MKTLLTFLGSRHQWRVGMLIPTAILPSLRSARLVGMALAIAASVGSADWIHTSGPTGGCVQAFAAIPSGTGGTKVFAGTYGGGVYVSSNDGESWRCVNNGLTSFDIRAFAVIGTNLFAGTYGGGVFLSTNSGTSWVAVNAGLSNLTVRAFAVTGSTVFAATHGGVFRSTNNGLNWSAVNNGLTNLQVRAIAFMGNYLFAGTRGSIFRSSNSGESWTIVPSSPGGIRAFAIIGDTLFAGGEVYRSTDSGTTWTRLTWSPWSEYQVTCLSAIGGTLFVGTMRGGLWRSTDRGASWSWIYNGFTDATIWGMTSVGASLFVGTDVKAIFRSTDRGVNWTWTAANVGISNVRTISLTTRGTRLFAGAVVPVPEQAYGYEREAAEAGIFYTSDNGGNWHKTNSLYSSYDWEYRLATSGADIYAGSSGLNDGPVVGDVFRSTNDGANWVQTTFGWYSVRVLAVKGTDIFAGGFPVGQSERLGRSTDAGASWTLITGLTSDVSALAFGDTTLFAGGWGGVFRSTNNGGLWTPINSGLPARRSIQCLAVSAGTVFAGVDSSGVFGTTNNGESWTEVNNGLTSRNVRAFAVSGNHVFAGTDGGVFLSTNNGTNWTSVNTGLSFPFVCALHVSNGNLYAGTSGNGVWRRPLSEMTDVESKQLLPTRFVLEQNYPNPFNPTTEIRYQIPEVRGQKSEVSRVTLKVFDILGREVATLVDEVQEAGFKSVKWDASNVASGVYLYRLQARQTDGGQAGSSVNTRKLVVLR